MNGVPAYSGAVTNPMMLTAIESTRQHLAKFLPVSWGALDHLPNHPAKKYAEIDEPKMLRRWQSDCRAVVLQFEAMSGLSWRPIDKEEQTAEGGGGGGAFFAKAKVGELSLIEITRPKRGVLVLQAADVARRANERIRPKSEELANRDRLCEIAVQVVPQHAFWSSVLPMHPERMPRTLEVVQLALDVAFVVEQRFKHALAVPRPYEVNPAVCPALLTPAHGSMPSGHATEAFTVATVLAKLLKDDKGTGATLRRLAQRIADNRQVAGLHYAIDTLAGQMLGTVLGNYLVALCCGGQVRSGRFDGLKLVGDEVCHEDGDPPGAVAAVTSGKSLEITRNEQLHWLWHEARLEWGAALNEDKKPRAGKPAVKSSEPAPVLAAAEPAKK